MKSIPILVVVLLLLVVLTPVRAAPKTKTRFAAKASLVAGNISMGTQSITQQGILHVKGAISEGTVTSISGPDISGTLWTILDGSGNLNTGDGSFHGKWTITTVNGTLEGSTVGDVVLTNSTFGWISGSFSGQGTINHTEQKLKASFEGQVTMGILQVELAIEGIVSTSKEK